MFKGLQKVLVNFGVNVLLANAFNILITNEVFVKAYLINIINTNVKPSALTNVIPGEDDATKKSYLLAAASYVIGAIFDYLILNQEAIKQKLEPVIKV